MFTVWPAPEASPTIEWVSRILAEERGIALLEVAVGGLLTMPAIASVIAGATKPEQVRANAAAGSWEPDAADVAALKALR